MTTDLPRINADMETARLHLLAEIHAEQQVQTEWLHRIRDLLSITYDLHAERAPRPSTACLACGVDGGQHRLDCTRQFTPGGHIAGPGDVHEAGGCETCADTSTDGHIWHTALDGTVEVCCECGTARKNTPDSDQ